MGPLSFFILTTREKKKVKTAYTCRKYASQFIDLLCVITSIITCLITLSSFRYLTFILE